MSIAATATSDYLLIVSIIAAMLVMETGFETRPGDEIDDIFVVIGGS